MSDSHFGAQARDVVLPGAGHANDGEEMSEERSGSLTWRGSGRGQSRSWEWFKTNVLTLPS